VQTDHLSTWAVSSQDFSGMNNKYDDAAADDFRVPEDAAWMLDTVFVQGLYQRTRTGATGVNVRIYADRSGAPGNLVSAQLGLVPVHGLRNPDFLLTLPTPVALGPGIYWVSVQVILSGEHDGQWFWTTRNLRTGRSAHWQNPNGGFGEDCPTWTDMQSCIDGPVGPDLAFSLGGHAGCTIEGTSGDDTLMGTSDPDVICGRTGDDVLLGLGSGDLLVGGPGDDQAYGGRGEDFLVGFTGADKLRGGNGRDYLVADDRVADDRFSGGAGPDICVADRGDFTLGCEQVS
jgi:hypothetical protein